MECAVQMSALSSAVLRLVGCYFQLLPSLPESRRRAAEAQCRNSSSVLFGMARPEGLADTATLVKCTLENLTVNIWRLMRACERALAWLPESMQSEAEENMGEAFLCVFRALLPVLRQDGIKIVSLEGRDFDPNYAVESVNADEFGGEEGLVVAEMLEPILMRGGEAVKFGKIMLAKKGGEDVSGN